ncbi:MAG: sensor domain-containing diguanylate cyclase [Chloroflexota bacterium]|nr:sensor domain-containing diguanylate cyclase [Chloroflexota bacterium]
MIDADVHADRDAHRDIDTGAGAAQRVEIDLEQSVFPYRSLFETSIDGILLVTMQGTIFCANSAACAILGRTSEQITGTSIGTVLDEADPRTRRAFTELNNRGEFHGELAFLKHPPGTERKAGSGLSSRQVTDVLEELQNTGKLSGSLDFLQFSSPTFPVEVSCTVHEAGDQGKKISIIFRDVTERIQMLEALREMAIRDELTGLYNRREMMNILSDGVRQAAMHNASLSLAFADVDHFKEINDTHGHQVGDRVLREVSRVIQKELRPTDRLARYGGEEFSIILPGTTSVEGARIAEAARLAVAAHQFHLHGHMSQSLRSMGNLLPIHVTISIGVAAFPSDAISEQLLISTADKALYKAKHQGRNRVIAYGTNKLNSEPALRGA